jgi:hypothetical protein
MHININNINQWKWRGKTRGRGLIGLRTETRGAAVHLSGSKEEQPSDGDGELSTNFYVIVDGGIW